MATEGAHFPRPPVAAGHWLAPGFRALSAAGSLLAGTVAADCLWSGAAPAAAGGRDRHQSAGCVFAFRQRCPEALRAQSAARTDRRWLFRPLPQHQLSRRGAHLPLLRHGGDALAALCSAGRFWPSGVSAKYAQEGPIPRPLSRL